MPWSRAEVGPAVYENYDQRQLLLATLPPSKRQIRAALVVVVTMLVLFGVTVRYVNVQLPRVDAFIPILATTTVINDLITAILLFSQYCIVQRRALLVLASGYLFTSLIVIPWALAFPGVFSPTGLLSAGRQTTAWLYTYWHVGSPLILIVAVLVKDMDNISSESRHSPLVAVALTVAVAVATVCGLTWFTIAGERLLPTIVLPDGVNLNRTIATSLSVSIIALAGGALVLLWIRRRSVLDLWLMVVCCAWLLETATATLFVEARFSLGWYAGRIFGIVSTFVVLLALLSETLALYSNLAQSIIRRRSDRHARQIAMDAMAASIVHEIKQPLAAIVSNANAGRRWLTRAAPDVNEAHSSFTSIVNAGQRMNEIVDGVRSMFRKGAHGQKLFDVNELLQEALTMVDLDLRTQRISVTADLGSGLPQLFGDRGQLQQVFLNLISNAIEAMSPVTDRGRDLRICSALVENSSEIVIAVEDSGVGIKGESSDHIFEPFFTTKSTGTGVGLTICRVIVEAHGGSLQTTPNKPYGAIFRVTLPIGDL
jgi:signal transduction histidine kinase